MKKIVTAEIDGKSSVIINRAPYQMSFNSIGITSNEIWSTKDQHGSFSYSEAADNFLGIPPATNGTTFRIVEFSPSVEKKKFMHKTNSLDYAIVLKGKITLLLDEDTVELEEGDCVVQQGTSHAWINKTQNTATVAFILIDRN